MGADVRKKSAIKEEMSHRTRRAAAYAQRSMGVVPAEEKDFEQTGQLTLCSEDAMKKLCPQTISLQQTLAGSQMGVLTWLKIWPFERRTNPDCGLS